MADKKLKVTLTKSKNGRLKSHKACVAGLGLRKIRQSSILEDTPAVRRPDAGIKAKNRAQGVRFDQDLREDNSHYKCDSRSLVLQLKRAA